MLFVEIGLDFICTAPAILSAGFIISTDICIICIFTLFIHNLP